MQIEKNKVVSIWYTLTNNSGEVLDTNSGKQPLYFIQGIGNIIPGLEEALEGKATGDKMQVSIPPEKGYGLRNEQLVQKLPKNMFQGVEQIQPGMQFQAQSEQGGFQIITVTKVEGEEVHVDGNHPLAGETLNFDVEVEGIRDADQNELAHGHVHGPGGHQH